MAEKFSFFDPFVENGVYDREYNAQDFTNYFKALVTTGVMRSVGSQLEVTANGTNMATTISDGVAYILGRYYENDGVVEHIHDTESLGSSRIDRVVIRMSLEPHDRNVKSYVKKGTASTNPVAPSLVQNDNIFEISLAKVLITGGQTFIDTAAVTSERGTTGICPWAGSNILPSFDDNALAEHVGNTTIHTTSAEKTLWNSALQPGVYNANNKIMSFGPNKAVRAWNPIPWTSTVPELWEATLGLNKSFWGLLEVDIAGFSSASGGAKIIFEVGVLVPETGNSTLFKNTMKIVSMSTGFATNFYVELEHRPSWRGLFLKVYKRNYGDSICVTATLTTANNDATAYEFLNRWTAGTLHTTGITVPATIQKDYDARITENFQLASDGKYYIANAITQRGGTASATQTFAELGTAILNMDFALTGAGTLQVVSGNTAMVTTGVISTPNKTPKVVAMQFVGSSNGSNRGHGVFNLDWDAGVAYVYMWSTANSTYSNYATTFSRQSGSFQLNINNPSAAGISYRYFIM